MQHRCCAAAYINSGKCELFKQPMPVTITGQGLIYAEVVLQREKFWVLGDMVE